MARRIRNPEKQDPRDLAKKMIRQIGQYGEPAVEELQEIQEKHQPRQIFDMPEGPEKNSRLGAYISELRESLSHWVRQGQIEKLSKVKAEARRAARQEKPKPEKIKKKVTKKRVVEEEPEYIDDPEAIEVTYPGTYQGFRYEIFLLRNGKYAARVTNQARRLMPYADAKHGEAPVIQKHPVLKRRYSHVPSREGRPPVSGKEMAEVAVRKAINDTLQWYDDRGIRPIERPRKRKGVAGTVRRRTAGQASARKEEQTEAEKRKARKEILEARQARKKQRKVEALERKRREAEGVTKGAKPLAGGRSLYIPKSNPSVFSSFFEEDNTPTATRQTLDSLEEFKNSRKRWKKSLKENDPDFDAYFKAYDAVENARANAYLAGKKKIGKKALQMKRDFRQEGITLMTSMKGSFGEEYEEGEYTVTQDGPARRNPGPEAHRRIGNEKLDKAERSLATYMRNGNSTSLLNAYKHFELALEELSYAKDREGIRRAKKGINIARGEMKGLMGK